MRSSTATEGGPSSTIDPSSARPSLHVLAILKAVRRTQATSSTWQVLTDRGRTEFVVDQEDHVRALDDGRFVITDSHGMRYLVPAPAELDRTSRQKLARFA